MQRRNLHGIAEFPADTALAPAIPPFACRRGGAWEFVPEGIEHHGMMILLGANAYPFCRIVFP